MKDLKHLKDNTGWDLCGVPIMCIHKGETPSKNVDRVVIHNFLKDTVLGFVATEKAAVPDDSQGCEDCPLETDAANDECKAYTGGKG